MQRTGDGEIWVQDVIDGLWANVGRCPFGATHRRNIAECSYCNGTNAKVVTCMLGIQEDDPDSRVQAAL